MNKFRESRRCELNQNAKSASSNWNRSRWDKNRGYLRLAQAEAFWLAAGSPPHTTTMNSPLGLSLILFLVSKRNSEVWVLWVSACQAPVLQQRGLSKTPTSQC